MELIIKDEYEDEDVFERRKNLTLKLFNFNINKITAIVIGRMVINKEEIGVKYDDEIETLITKIV